MFPKIKNTNSTFSFDSRLEPAELELLKSFIGKKINSLLVEQLNFSFDEEARLESYGRCCFRFQALDKGAEHLIFQSLYDEIQGPIVAQGGLLIQKIVTKTSRLLKDKILNPPHTIDKSFVVNIKYPTESPLQSIKFYGNHERANIKALDEWVDLEFVAKFGFQELPFVECDSIEFFVLEHEDQSKTFVSLKNGGFRFHLNGTKSQNKKTEEVLLSNPNGYGNKFILQHEIS